MDELDLSKAITGAAWTPVPTVGSQLENGMQGLQDHAYTCVHVYVCKQPAPAIPHGTLERLKF